MVEALVALGHRRIAFLAGPRSLYVARARLAGYRRGLAAAGIASDERLVVATTFDREGGALGVDELLASGAVHRDRCANDLLALGAMPGWRSWGSTCRARLGRRVRRHLGRGDDRPEPVHRPPAAPRPRPARLRARDADARRPRAGAEVLPTALVLRGSTGRAGRPPQPPPEEPLSLNLRGITPACVVTLDADGRFDEAPYRRYLQWLLPQGPVALAINADTGEGPHLWPDERERVLRVAVEEAGDVPVIAGLPPSSRSRPSRRRSARRGAAPAGCSCSRSRPTRAPRSTPRSRSRTTRPSPAAAACRWSRSSSSRRWAA